MSDTVQEPSFNPLKSAARTHVPSEGHAHVFRIRIDAEGTSASEIEGYFGLITARIQKGTNIAMNVSSQVIEMADNDREHPDDPKSPWRGSWYRGRLTLAPDMTSQLCNEIEGDRVAFGEKSVPAVYEAGQD